MLKHILWGVICLLAIPGELWGQNLIAYYPFDNQTADYSGNHNDGKAFGGVKPVADRFGTTCGALHFNGKDGYVSVPSSISLKSPQQQLSLSVWFKLDSAPSQQGNKWLTLICKGQEDEEQYYNPQYRVQIYQSKIQGTVSLNTDFTEYDTNYLENTIPYGAWIFYALVYDGKMVSTYMNGRKIWEHAYKNTFFPNDQPLDIGRDIPGHPEYFCGTMDELRIYNGALTEAEINTQYQQGNIAPVATTTVPDCPSDILVGTDPGKCTAKVNFNPFALDESCGRPFIRQTGGMKSGSAFPIGTSEVQFEVRDARGKIRDCTAHIVVSDQEAPSIKCLKDTILILKSSDAKGVVFNYTTPTAKDNCSNAPVTRTSGLASGSEFPLGKNTLNFMAQDESGNHSECAYNVYVVNPDQANLIETGPCMPDIEQEADPLQCGAIVRYTLPNTRYSVYSGLASGRLFPVGSSKVVLQRKINGGLTEQCSFNVVVKEKESPTILCMNDTTIRISGGQASVVVNYNTPEAFDNCAIASVNRIEGPASGSAFPIGNTIVTYEATDASGNTARCSFKVNVVGEGPAKPVSFEKTATKTYISDKVAYTPDMKFGQCTITLLLYDDGQEDQDTVSIYFNGVEVVSREMIQLKEHHIIVRTLQLNAGMRNDFVVKAWNTGNISPNTIKIDFFEGTYNPNSFHLQKQHPIKTRVLHSKPGLAGAISIQCNAR